MKPTTEIRSRKKVHNAWAMYDWANSVYNLVITTTFFPVYYGAVSSVTHYPDGIPFLGRHFVNTALKDYALAFAYLIIVFLSPILSAIADLRGSKKRFMQFFTTLGGVSCAALFFFNKGNILLGLGCFVLATIGYCGSLVFYNSYLPEIATDSEKDSVSARGFAYGYIGSVILQIIGFALVLLWPKDADGTDSALPVLITFVLVGIWWISFAQITFRNLPASVPRIRDEKKSVLTSGFLEIKKVALQVKALPVLKKYLLAFFFYSMGVQTVMLVAVDFGSKVLELPAINLIITVVIIQLVAIAGAWMMSQLSAVYGNLKVLLFAVCLWIFICIAGYYMQTAMHFYMIAAAVGLVMGGIQSLSRSTYAKMMPATKDTASFFSFYDVTEKLAIVIGLFSFGFIEEFTSSRSSNLGDAMRNSVLSLILFFIVGAVLLIVAERNNSKLKIK